MNQVGESLNAPERVTNVSYVAPRERLLDHQIGRRNKVIDQPDLRQDK